MNEEYPATAAEARKLGVKHFFTGKRCKHGHVVTRYASNGTCSACDYSHTDKKVTPRQVAQKNGASTYEGKPCCRCGNTTKDTSGRRCTICRIHRMTPHEIKVMVVTHPHRHVLWYAKKARRNERAIYTAFESLNIPRRGKPPHYVG